MLCDEKVGSDRKIYIGKTLFVHERINRIKPLAVADSDGWQKVSETQFPRHGSVFSFDHAVVGKPEGYVILFTVERNTHPQTGRDYDEFITDEVCEPYQVVSGFGDLPADDQRSLVTLRGLYRALQSKKRIILPIGGSKAAFPEFKNNNNDGKWIIATDDNLSALPIYEFNADKNGNNFFYINGRHYLLPGLAPEIKIGHVNWESDSAFLDDLLNHLRKIDSITPGGALRDVSKKTLERLQSAYKAAEIINGENGRNEAIHFRLSSFLPRIRDEVHAVDKIAQSLMENSAIKAKLIELSEAEKQDRLAQVEEEFRTEIQNRVKAESQDAINKNKELTSKNEELELAILERIEQLERYDQLNQQRFEDAQTAIDSFVGRVLDGGTKFTKLLETARDMGLNIPSGKTKTHDVQVNAPPWSATSNNDAELVDEKGMLSTLAAAARNSGIDIALFAKLDIVTRSGDIPIVSGGASELLIKAYAACATGGTFHRLIADPMILGIDDLWIHPARKRPTALAEAWQSATNDNSRYWLVVLEDVDNERLSPWFDRFAAVFRTTRPANLLIVATKRDAAGKDQGTSESSQVKICANATPNITNAILGQKGDPILPHTRLAYQPRKILDDQERMVLSAAVKTMKSISPDTATRLVRMTEAAKPWNGVIQGTQELIFEMTGLRTEEKNNA